MPANTDFTSLISSTLDAYIKNEVTDQVVNNNALLQVLQSKGNIIHETGGTNFRENIRYSANSTINWHDPTDTIDITPQDEFSTAVFAQKFISASFQINLKEKLQNAGNSAIFNLLNERLKALMGDLKNAVGVALFDDGSGYGSKTLNGLQSIIADDPTSGTVGGINRANNAFWRNQVYDFSTSAGANASASNIQAGMNKLYLDCQIQENSIPDLIIADSNYYGFFESSLQQIQRITNTGEGKLGFGNLAYKNSSVVYDPNCPANHMYFINTDHVKFKHLNSPLFTQESTQRPINQLTYVTPVYLYGNLTISSARVHGVAKN